MTRMNFRSIFKGASRFTMIFCLLIMFSGCASLVVKPYEQYNSTDRALLRVTSGSLNVNTLQTYVMHENCTNRRRMDGVGGTFRSPTDIHHIPPNRPFVMSVYANKGSKFCIYSLSFIPESNKNYELNIEMDPKNYCFSSFNQGGVSNPILVSHGLPGGVVESSPFCKGQFFQQYNSGVFETTVYRQDGFGVTPLRRKE